MAPKAGPSPLEQLNSHYDKLQEAQEKLAEARSGLDSLVKMGDTVDVADVVKVAGRLVAKGLDPTSMVSLLSEMPDKPEMLVEWLHQHDQQLAQREEDLAKVSLVVRHQMGVEGLRALMAPGRAPGPADAPPSMMAPAAPAEAVPNA